MATLNRTGASAPRANAPCRSDDAPAGGIGRGARENEEADSLDSASHTAERKLIDSLLARAALQGLEVHRLADGSWLLRHARGASIGIVHGVDALAAAVSGFEAAQADVRDLVQRMRGAA